MPIEFPCPSCKRPLRVPDGSEGRQARCPACATTCTVPGGEAAANPFSMPPSTPPAAEGNPFREGSGSSYPTNPFQPDSTAQVNPYAAPAPPAAALAPSSGTKPTLRVTRIQFGEVMGRVWEILTNRFLECLLAGLVLAGISVGLWFVGQVLSAAAQLSNEPSVIIGLTFGWNIITQLVNVWLQLGLINFGLNLSRTGKGTPADIFSVGPYFARGLGVLFLIFLTSMGIIIVAAIPPVVVLFVQGPNNIDKEPIPMIVVCFISFAFAFILLTWIQLRWMLAFVFIVDRNAGAFESLTFSSEYMNGNIFTVLVTYFVVGFLMMLVFICSCGIGLLIAYPCYGLLSTVIYLMATGQPHGQFLPGATPPSATR